MCEHRRRRLCVRCDLACSVQLCAACTRKTVHPQIKGAYASLFNYRAASMPMCAGGVISGTRRAQRPEPAAGGRPRRYTQRGPTRHAPAAHRQDSAARAPPRNEPVRFTRSALRLAYCARDLRAKGSYVPARHDLTVPTYALRLR